jgi:hypothetical protein
MWMERATWTLRKAVVYVLCRMLMGINGRDLGGTYKFSMYNQIERRAEGLSFLRREGLHM